MLEPVLNMDEDMDLLDILLEMKMEEILNHPVIVEVMNVVHEGKYSVDSSLINLSSTFQVFFHIDIFELKGVCSRLI